MNIEQLAIKRDIHICKYDRQDLFEGNVVFDSIAQLKAFADEWLALNSSEPLYLAKNSLQIDSWYFVSDYVYNTMAESSRLKVFKANPINQALVESHKKLQEALRMWQETINYQYTASREAMSHLQNSDNNAVEALAYRPASLEQLLGGE